MKKLLAFIFTMNAFFAFAQAPAIAWQNTIGGSGSDSLLGALQTSDNGFILAGYSSSNISGDKTENSKGGNDYWIVKIDDLGNIQWQKTIGGNTVDSLQDLVATNDGGFILGGYSASGISGDKSETSVNGDYWIVKIDNLGNIQWQNTLTGNDIDFGTSIAQTSDGGYIVGGYSHSNMGFDKSENNMGSVANPEDYWVIKLDAIGNIQWENTIGGNNTDVLNKIIQTTDGGYLVGGHSYSPISGDKISPNAANDYWIVKLDNLGNIQWQKTYGGDSIDELEVIGITNDGGYIIGGRSSSNISGTKTENSRGNTDYWIIKTDNSGNIQWQKTIGGSSADDLYSIKQLSDSGYIISGKSSSSISGEKTENSRGQYDYWILRTDALGNILWQKTIGGSLNEGGSFILPTSDGGFFSYGDSQSNISGEKTENSQGNYDFWVIKLDPENLSIPDNAFVTIGVYPNPTSGRVTVKMGQEHATVKTSIVNLLGQVIQKENFSNTKEFALQINGASGIYFINLETDGVKSSHKVIKE